MSARFSNPRRVCQLSVAAAFLLAGPPLAAQTPRWSVDLTQATFQARGETYTDHLCNEPGPPPPLFVPRPPPFGSGTCPPFPPGPAVPFNPFGDIDRQETQILSAPYSFFGFPFDIGGGITANARDMCPFAIQSTSEGTSLFLADGLGTRTLSAFLNTRVNNAGIDTDWYCRGCVDIFVDFVAELQNVPTTQFFVRYDYVFSGNADTTIECGGAFGCQEFPDDVEEADMTATLEFNGAGPLVLANSFLDSQAPGLPVYLDDDSDRVSFGAGTNAVAVDVDLLARSSAKHQTPELNPADGSNFDAIVSLHLIVHDFLTDEPFDSYMRPVGGGSYPLRMGRSEVTNQQYADFLNSAEDDAGATELSSFMVFGPDGQVTLADGTLLFEPQGLQSECHVVYEPAAALGTRYTVDIQSGASARSYESHPITHLSWIGALKFCNWLTMKRGLGAAERCYGEGPSLADWHPVTISTVAWGARDLNANERAQLLGQRGFRLPMDGLGTQNGWIGSQTGTFNEWYRAAAFDPNGPPAARAGPLGETVPARHWIYGVGRDALGGPDANFFASTDPFDQDDAFVALFDGSVYNTAGSELIGGGAGFASAATTNPWGLYDLSGNIAEYVQDRPSRRTRAVRGGSWLDVPEKCAATYRELTPVDVGANFIGFRVVQAQRTKVRLVGQPDAF